MERNSVLVSLRPYLVEDVIYKHVAAQLISKGLISQNEDSEIMQRVGKDKVRRLLDLIITRERALDDLIDALSHPTVYPIYKNLVSKLEYTAKTQALLAESNGNVKTSAERECTIVSKIEDDMWFNRPILETDLLPNCHLVFSLWIFLETKLLLEKIRYMKSKDTIRFERRHFNDVVKILKKDVTKWEKFYECLGIEKSEMFSTAQKLNRGAIDAAEAYRDVIDAWKENTGRKATFGILDDVLRNKIYWIEAADELNRRHWE